MPVRREHPYIWTTWLPRLLTGENSCEWAAWFKAHHQEWDQVPSDFDQTQWLIDHTALLNEQKSEWAERGNEMSVENQNSFRLRGEAAILAGKPDLIVKTGEDALIIDVKTGREQTSHRVQVMIYQFALPRAFPQYEGARIAGRVVYPTRTVRVPMSALRGQFIDQLGSLIRRIASETPAQRVPSRQECRFCDISAADCPERVDGAVQPEQGTTADF